MNKSKILMITVGVGIALMSSAANAAKSSRGDKGGVFIGLEGDYDSVSYSHYAVSTTGTINQTLSITPKSSVANNYSGYLVLGSRFYLNNFLGFGVKTWGGASTHNNRSNYEVGNGTGLIGDFNIKADAKIIGVGAQVYIDFWNFKNGALGITLGSGYELTQFSNVSVQTVHQASNVNHYDTVEDYFDKALVLDGALHLQLGDRNRLEVGYKIKDYDTEKYVMQTDAPGYGRTVGFNVKNSIFANYTFSF